jgi:aminopeptidase
MSVISLGFACHKPQKNVFCFATLSCYITAMKDIRIEKLARNLLTHSCKLQRGQSVIIEAAPEAKDLVVEIVRQVYAMGAMPFVRLGDEEIGRAVMMGLTEAVSKRMCK